MMLPPDTLLELQDLARSLGSQQPPSANLRRRHPRLNDDGIVAYARISTGLGDFSPERRVVLVDVSTSGLQLIWYGFVHAGTVFSFTLQRPGGSPVEVEAAVVWCKHVRNRYHAVGLQALTPIPLNEIVSQKIWLDACAKNPELQHPVTGCMVIFGENELTVQSALFQVRDSGVNVQVAQSRGELMDLIERGEVDILVVDADPESLDVTEFISACRSRSFNGPMILLSLDREAEYLASMDPTHRCRFVQLPMPTNAIIAAVRDVLRTNPDCILDAAEIYSQSPKTPNRDEALKRFISLAQSLCKEGRHALEVERYDAAIKVAQSLAASGGSHGYPELSVAAMQFLTAAYDPKQQKRLSSLFKNVEAIVDRLRPGEPGKSAA